MKLQNAHAVAAIKPINETDVEVRFTDGRKSEILKDTTVADVVRQVTAAKAAKSDTDSA